MSLSSRRELLTLTASRYHKTRRRQKRRILDEFTAATGYGRKYAITLLNNPPVVDERRRKARPARRYDEEVRQALVTVWRAANRICSKRLVPFLPEFVSAMERFGHLSLTLDVREKLLSISVSTVDRLLQSERHPGRRGIGTTQGSKLLKRQIRVRTFADWDDMSPGFLEADLVAHCGESVEGSFLNTLVLTDIASGWTECLALLRRSEADVLGALNAIRHSLPFPLLGLDTDNGSEFINYELLRYCEHEKITFTRARVRRRNDQAHVEEKNGSVVRRLIGYDRYEGEQAWRVLMDLYRVLRLYVNFFQPSLKLITKQRVGAHVTKRYDRAKTPCQRLLASKATNEDLKDRLRRQYRGLDPVALLAELELLQDRFWQYANGAELGSPEPSSEQERSTGILKPAEETKEKKASARMYRRTKKARAPRTWRTREDPFADVWSLVRLQLQIDPSQTAKNLLKELQERYPNRFQDGQLRTLQRRVREWRQEHMYSDEAARRSFYTNIAPSG